MNRNNNNSNDHLGVNKMGKNIRKSPLHQPNFANNNNNNKQQQQQQSNQQPPPQPHVYNISKNDFRNIVQQLTGSPSHNQPPPRPPPHNPPKPPSMRLQRIRPPPLSPIARPHHNPHPNPTNPNPVLPLPQFNNGFHSHRPPPPHPQIAQQPPYPPPMMPPHGEPGWANRAESPISAYMRYLQSSMTDPSPRQIHPQNQLQHPPHGQVQSHLPGLLPTPPGSAPFPSPRGNGSSFLPSPTSQFLLQSPTSQFLLPSPSAYMNLLSPRSPYPLLSPGFQFPSPLTPGFFSPLAHQSGILGPGPQPPPSPGLLFPPSPSAFFPMSSPRWRDH